MSLKSTMYSLIKTIKRFMFSLYLIICSAVLYSAKALSDYTRLHNLSGITQVSPFSKIFILFYLVLFIIFIRLWRLEITMLFISFLISNILLSLYQVFKDPQIQN